MAVASMAMDVIDRRTIPSVREFSAAPIPSEMAFRASSPAVNIRLSRSRRPISGRLLIGFATLQKIRDGARICAYRPASSHCWPKINMITAWPATRTIR